MEDEVLENEVKVQNSLRRRISYTQNSKGFNTETTYELTENGKVISNQEAVDAAKELFELAKKAVGN